MIKAIIFDFDGVILESGNVKAEAFAYVYRYCEPQIIDKIVEHHKQNGGMSRYRKFEYYHKNFLHKGLTDDEMKQMDKQFNAFVMKRIAEVPQVGGVGEFLEANKDKFLMFVSSGAPEYELMQVIRLRGLTNYFLGIYGSPKNKVAHINEILNRYSLQAGEVVFVGDGKQDKISAEATGLHFVARISSPSSVLKNEKYKIYDFYEFPQIISKF